MLHKNLEFLNIAIPDFEYLSFKADFLKVSTQQLLLLHAFGIKK